MIDSESLALVAKAGADKASRFPAGNYLVSVSLPSGERRVVVTEIEPGGAAESPSFPRRRRRMPPPAPAPPPDGLEGLGPTFGGRVPDVRGTVLRRRRATGASKPVEPRVVVIPRRRARSWRSTSSGGEGVLFAQVGLEDEVPLNVALPVAGPTRQQSCRLTVERGVGAL